MKVIFVSLFISILFWSCNNDCLKVDCLAKDSKPCLGFTIKSGNVNLIASKKIDIRKIKALDLDFVTTKPIFVDFNYPQQDSVFRLKFSDLTRKVKLTWISDSTIIDLDYSINPTECCGDLTRIVSVNIDGKELLDNNEILIINK